MRSSTLGPELKLHVEFDIEGDMLTDDVPLDVDTLSDAIMVEFDKDRNKGTAYRNIYSAVTNLEVTEVKE